MNIPLLAARRAQCAAELETLTQIEPAGDAVEQLGHNQAVVAARRTYQEAEDAYQRAISLLTSAEIAAQAHG